MGSLCAKEQEDGPVQLNETQRLRIEAIFEQLDADNDGYLAFDEFGPKMKLRIAHQLGHQPDEEQLAQLFDQADTNNDGKMSKEEFIVLITTNMGPPKNVELHDAFDLFDTDNDGVLSAADLHASFASVGDDYITLAHCEEIICRVDKNGDGVVHFKEFKQMWKDYLAQSGGEIPFTLVDEDPRRYSRLRLDIDKGALTEASTQTTKKSLEDLKVNEADNFAESEYIKEETNNDSGKCPPLEDTSSLLPNSLMRSSVFEISDDILPGAPTAEERSEQEANGYDVAMFTGGDDVEN